VNSSLKYVLKPSNTTTIKCVSTKTYVVHLNIKIFYKLKNSSETTKQTPCGHQVIIKNKMREGN
jgi:hypothetical protein